jgi:hypothetical protein
MTRRSVRPHGRVGGRVKSLDESRPPQVRLSCQGSRFVPGLAVYTPAPSLPEWDLAIEHHAGADGASKVLLLLPT